MHYFVTGSILRRATKHTVVWGSGFISAIDKCYEKPKKICAVRGPLTMQILSREGISCPEVYGDPALLLPLFYSPITNKKYKVGLIPHYVDKESKWLKSIKNDKNIKIIDVQNSNPLKFIDDILQCEKIASSSLHGIIVADAYNIHSVWVEFSNSVFGNGFKFIDYFMSVKRLDRKPFIIKNDTTVTDIFKNSSPYTIDIDLKKLIDCCPFR
jgi:pyruvyltransferase